MRSTMPGRAAGTGRFNLASGTVGAMNAIAAAASTAITGLVFQNFGHGVTFLLIAAVAAFATSCLGYSVGDAAGTLLGLSQVLRAKPLKPIHWRAFDQRQGASTMLFLVNAACGCEFRARSCEVMPAGGSGRDRWLHPSFRAGEQDFRS
jgi:hypothetical protein